MPSIPSQVGNYLLQNRDYTLIIDKSGSMSNRDMPNNQSRWQAAEESVYAIAAKVFEFDPDGLDIWLFSNNHKCYPNVGPSTVTQIFQENEPFGGTRMAEVLQKALDEYFHKRDTGKVKPQGEVILVVTDGQPDSREDVVKVLVNSANRLRPSDNLALNFVQVGYDKDATAFLNFLDNELMHKAGARCDFVETVKMGDIEEQGLKQVLLNTLTKTLRQPTQIG